MRWDTAKSGDRVMLSGGLFRGRTRQIGRRQGSAQMEKRRLVAVKIGKITL